MWKWMKKQVVRAFRFVKELIKGISNRLIDTAETLSEGNNLLRLAVGTLTVLVFAAAIYKFPVFVGAILVTLLFCVLDSVSSRRGDLQTCDCCDDCCDDHGMGQAVAA